MGISFGAVGGAGRWSSGRVASKSFADAGLGRFQMQSSSSRAGVTGNAPQLSTRTSLFSTRYAHALQVRDPIFVKRAAEGTYLGTGVDSRVGLASAPAMLIASPRLRAPRPFVAYAPQGKPASRSTITV